MYNKHLSCGPELIYDDAAAAVAYSPLLMNTIDWTWGRGWGMVDSLRVHFYSFHMYISTKTMDANVSLILFWLNLFKRAYAAESIADGKNSTHCLKQCCAQCVCVPTLGEAKAKVNNNKVV